MGRASLPAGAAVLDPGPGRVRQCPLSWTDRLDDKCHMAATLSASGASPGCSQPAVPRTVTGGAFLRAEAEEGGGWGRGEADELAQAGGRQVAQEERAGRGWFVKHRRGAQGK
eukprot:886871-Prorocentrum_minimum.AAC.1